MSQTQKKCVTELSTHISLSIFWLKFNARSGKIESNHQSARAPPALERGSTCVLNVEKYLTPKKKWTTTSETSMTRTSTWGMVKSIGNNTPWQIWVVYPPFLMHKPLENLRVFSQ
jgi:hypothetical protein